MRWLIVRASSKTLSAIDFINYALSSVPEYASAIVSVSIPQMRSYWGKMIAQVKQAPRTRPALDCTLQHQSQILLLGQPLSDGRRYPVARI